MQHRQSHEHTCKHKYCMMYYDTITIMFCIYKYGIYDVLLLTIVNNGHTVSTIYSQQDRNHYLYNNNNNNNNNNHYRHHHHSHHYAKYNGCLIS